MVKAENSTQPTPSDHRKTVRLVERSGILAIRDKAARDVTLRTNQTGAKAQSGGATTGCRNEL